MKNNIASIQAKLKELSKSWDKSHQITLTRFFQERILFRLSKTKYNPKFFLKGGVLIYTIEREESRPTLDLDLLAEKIEADLEKIKTIFQEICEIPSNDGVSFDPTSGTRHKFLTILIKRFTILVKAFKLPF